jgi:ESS family glutamate:Na+ symporter
MDIAQVMLDVSIMGGFLLVGAVVRSRVRILQKFVIPASVIGGLLGLLFGPNGLGWIPMSDSLVQYAAALFSIVFAGIFIGRKIPGIGSILKNAGAQYGFAVVNGLGQMAIGMLVVVVFALIGLSLHSTFGLMLVAGFQGGPGIPTAVSPMFDKLGWNASEAAAVGETCAIAGLILSVVIGVILVNWGRAKGFTAKDHGTSKGLAETPTFRPVTDRKPLGIHLTHSEALSTLGYCFAFIGAAIVIGKLMQVGVVAAVPLLKYIPVFPFVLVAGLVVQVFLQLTKLDSYVDHETTNELSSFALDYVIVAALMALDLKVVMSFGLPIIVMLLLGAVFNIWWAMWLAPRTLPGAWFEKSLCEFGQATGATPQALMLLKMVDPDLDSGAADPFALKLFLFIPTINLLPLMLAPVIAVKGAPLFLAIFCGAAVAVMIIMRIFSWRRRPEVTWFGSETSKSGAGLPVSE